MKKIITLIAVLSLLSTAWAQTVHVRVQTDIYDYLHDELVTVPAGQMAGYVMHDEVPPYWCLIKWFQATPAYPNPLTYREGWLPCVNLGGYYLPR